LAGLSPIEADSNRRAGHQLRISGQLVETCHSLITDGLELIGRGLKTAGDVRKLNLWRCKILHKRPRIAIRGLWELLTRGLVRVLVG